MQSLQAGRGGAPAEKGPKSADMTGTRLTTVTHCCAGLLQRQRQLSDGNRNGCSCPDVRVAWGSRRRGAV